MEVQIDARARGRLLVESGCVDGPRKGGFGSQQGNRSAVARFLVESRGLFRIVFSLLDVLWKEVIGGIDWKVVPQGPEPKQHLPQDLLPINGKLESHSEVRVVEG